LVQTKLLGGSHHGGISHYARSGSSINRAAPEANNSALKDLLGLSDHIETPIAIFTLFRLRRKNGNLYSRNLVLGVYAGASQGSALGHDLSLENGNHNLTPGNFVRGFIG
jgi:hypothetical protein